MMNEKPLMRISESSAPLLDVGLAALELFPAVGIGIGILKIKDDYQERVLRARIEAFINGIGNHEEAAKLVRQLKDPDAVQVQESVLLTLDSLDSTSKCKFIGAVFKAYLLGDISSAEMRRLALIIKNSFTDDLELLISKYGDIYFEIDPENDLFSGLSTSGLVKFLAGYGPSADEQIPPRYVLTELGEKMLKAITA